ncbi:hypothetical protein D3C78_1283970 [compost metagenome]
MPLRYAGDQVRSPRQSNRRREASDNGGDVARQFQLIQGIVHDALFVAPTRDQDVPGGGITNRCHLASSQWMTLAHDANEPVAKQHPGPHFRAGRFADHTGFQVHRAVAQQGAVLVQLLHEIQADTGCFLVEAGDQWWSEIFHEAIAGAQGEGARQLIEVQCLGGAQDGFGILHECADAFTQLQRPGRGNQSATGPHQQRITRGFAQPRQRPAHG